MSKENKKIWDNEIIPQIKSEAINFIENWKDNFSKDEYTLSENEYLSSLDDYKKEHNGFLYWLIIFTLPFAFLLFFYPGYVLYKKFKTLKENKNNLKDIIKETTEKKLLAHAKIVKTIDLISISKSIGKILKYDHVGPISNNLIKEMQDLSLFKFSESDEKNSYNSSWGIFDKNKIIINAAYQKHESFEKTYYGSTSVSYTTHDSDGASVTRNEEVRAEYVHPAYDIYSKKSSYVFMESCSNLEFYYDGKKSFIKRLKNKEQSKMENDEFEKKFTWIRNDEVQFRMIFTILGQEIFLNETEEGKKNIIKHEDSYYKEKSFLGNSYVSSASLAYKFNINDILIKFISNADITIDELKMNLINEIKNYIYEQYKSMKFLWTIPILQSEDSSLIIKKIAKEKNTNDNSSLVSQYLLNDVSQSKIIDGKFNTFKKSLKNYTYEFNNITLNKTLFNGLNYNIVKKITDIPQYSTVAGKTVYVTVEYDDYIPRNAQADLCYGYIKTNKYYIDNDSFLTISTNITNEETISSINSIKDLNIQLNIVDNYLVLYSINNIDDTVIRPYIESIVSNINND